MSDNTQKKLEKIEALNQIALDAIAEAKRIADTISCPYVFIVPAEVGSYVEQEDYSDSWNSSQVCW